MSAPYSLLTPEQKAERIRQSAAFYWRDPEAARARARAYRKLQGERTLAARMDDDARTRELREAALRRAGIDGKAR